MAKRSGKFGEFYGCTGYPLCRSTRTLRDVADQEDPPQDVDKVNGDWAAEKWEIDHHGDDD